MKTAIRVFLFIILLTILTATSLAVPSGPRVLTSIKNGTLPVRDSVSALAIAGNVSEININAWTVTRTWQGYYGNVTGTIVLADQNNFTLYDWSNTDPNGRIYATRLSTTPVWGSVRCANTTELNVYEAQFSGTNETDRDGRYPVDSPNVTFVNSTRPLTSQYANYSRFWVGPVQINGTGEPNECFSTVMHNATGWVDAQQNAGNDQNRFREVVLSDGNGQNHLVYTAILEHDYTGFDGATHDFEMIVTEDGHGTDTSTTTYYFYVELD